MHQNRLELRTFGAVALRGRVPGTDPSALLRQPKRLGLALYLLLQGKGGLVYRDRLTSMFWPEAPEEGARASLRQALRFMGAALGERAVLREGRARVGLDTSRIDCDALQFDALLAQGRHDDALVLYQGELLDGFFLPDASHAFQDWLEEQRATYRTTASEAAWSIAAKAEAQRRPLGAAYWGKRALALSPFGELQVQRLMRLLHRVGDRAGALRAYRGLEDWLRREYQSEPSATTRELLEQVRTLPETMGADGFSGRRSGVDRRRTERRGRDVGRASGERRLGADRRSDAARRRLHDRRNPH